MEGSHDVAVRDRVLVLDSFEPRVPRAIQLEGTGFHLHGRVLVISTRHDRVHAIVRAGRPHDVTAAVTSDGKVAVACDCVPFQEQPFVCRHIWATLITVLNEDLLRLPEATVAIP